MHLKGRITAIDRTSGGLSVTVDGRVSDRFHIDNCLVTGILDVEGPDWIGRLIEYDDGYVRFLDAIPDSPTPHPAPISCPYSLS